MRLNANRLCSGGWCFGSHAITELAEIFSDERSSDRAISAAFLAAPSGLTAPQLVTILMRLASQSGSTTRIRSSSSGSKPLSGFFMRACQINVPRVNLKQFAREVTRVVALFELPAIFARCPACILAKGHAERARLRVAKRKPDVRDRD